MENFDITYTVKRKSEGIYKRFRALFISIYILFPVSLIVLCAFVKLILPTLAVTPIFEWMLVYFTWRYVDIEYEVKIESGVLKITKILGEKHRKAMFEVPVKQLTDVSHYVPGAVLGYKKVYITESRKSFENTLSAIAEIKGKKRLLLLDTIPKAEKVINYYK